MLGAQHCLYIWWLQGNKDLSIKPWSEMITGNFSCFNSLQGPLCGAGKKVGLEFRESWDRQMLGHEANQNMVCSPAADPGNRFPCPQLGVVAVELISCCVSFLSSGLFSRLLQAIEKKLWMFSIYRNHNNMVRFSTLQASPQDHKDLNCSFTAEPACTRRAVDFSSLQ